MLYILLMLGLITIVTFGIMLLISADLSAGIRQSQSVRAFSITEAGVYYAVGRLQMSGAASYAGETVIVTDGSVTLGTASVAVGCINGLPLPCLDLLAPFRRIVSAGSLPVSGPSRTVVAVVQGVPLSSRVVCAQDSVQFGQGVTVYGDLGSNGTISLTGSLANYSRVRRDAPAPFVNWGFFNGDARAAGAITCSQGCALQVQGTTTPNAPGTMCPVPALPAFTPGPDPLAVTPLGSTMDATTGYDWDTVILADAGTAFGCTGLTPFTDLRIQAGPAGTTTVVNIQRLIIGRCGRLIIVGDGKVDLRIAEATLGAIEAGQYARIGVLPSDTVANPAPVPAGQFVVSIRSSATAAVHLDRAALVAGTYIVPNGGWDQDQSAAAAGKVYGSVFAKTLSVDRDVAFTFDASTTTWSNFNAVRSWKDQ
jgi:hypothetical protein